MNILYILLALGIIGHAINMYCDRILSIFPNGTLHIAAMVSMLGWMFLI